MGKTFFMYYGEDFLYYREDFLYDGEDFLYYGGDFLYYGSAILQLLFESVMVQFTSRSVILP